MDAICPVYGERIFILQTQANAGLRDLHVVSSRLG